MCLLPLSVEQRSAAKKRGDINWDVDRDTEIDHWERDLDGDGDVDWV